MSNSPNIKPATYIYQIDVSGKSGDKGENATQYPLDQDSVFDVKANYSGSRGGEGQRGMNADNVHIFIALSGKDQNLETADKLQVKLKIDRYFNEDLGTRKNISLKLSRGDKIKVDANGGDGGMGGKGGHGLNSVRRYTPAGDGGYGGWGGNGGHGGNIHLEAGADQSFLLSYFDCSVKGGKGGEGGEGGLKGRFKNVEPLDGMHQSQNGKLGQRGKKGKDGNLEYILAETETEPGGIYKGLFDIEIEGVSWVDALPDGVYEFGEEIQVKHIGIQNIGLMPSPINNPIRIRIKENEWLKAEPEFLSIPGGIDKRIRKNFFNPFIIQIKQMPEDRISEGAPIRNIPLEFEAILPRTGMAFPQAKFQQQIPVQYPLKLSDFQVIQSLGPGESGTISWKTENLSSHMAKSKFSDRLMQTRIKLKEADDFSALDSKSVSLLDKHQRRLSVLAFRLFDIEKKLQFQEEQYFFNIAANADTLLDIHLELSLEIGELDFPELARPIQKIPFQLRITQRYQKTEASDVLVIFHQGVEVKSLKKLENFYREIGSTVDFWDLSYYGFLDLEKKLESGKSLLEDFEGKTILLLNFPYKNLQGDEVLPALFLKQSQFHRAVNEFGIEFLLIGETQWRNIPFIEWLNLPTMSRKIYNRYRRLEEFVDFLQTRTQEGVDGKEGFLHRPLGMLAYPEDNISNRSYEIWIRKRDLGRKYQKKYTSEILQAICKDLARQMEGKFPREQFFFVYEYLKQDDEGFLGKIEVKQGPHKIHGANILGWNLKRSIYEETIDSETPSVGFFLYLSLSNWEFKEMLMEFLARKPGYLESHQAINDARDALMYRIVLEFMNLKSFHSFSTEKLKEQLGFFHMVFDCNIGHLEINSPQTRLFGELCVHILAFIESQKSLRGKLLIKKDEYRLTRLIQQMLESWINRNFDESEELRQLDRKLWERNRREGRSFRQSIRERRKNLLRRYTKLARKHKISVAEAAQNLCLKEVQNLSVKGNSIFSRKEFEALCKIWQSDENTFTSLEQKEITLIETLRKS